MGVRIFDFVRLAPDFAQHDRRNAVQVYFSKYSFTNIAVA